MDAIEDPIILTARFDPDTEERFQAARDRWFPPRLNIVPAHLTLFHKLPGEELGAVRRLAAEAAAATAPFDAHVTSLMSLGGG